MSYELVWGQAYLPADVTLESWFKIILGSLFQVLRGPHLFGLEKFFEDDRVSWGLWEGEYLERYQIINFIHQRQK